MDFKYLKWRNRKQTGYDRKKITIKMAGKEFNVYDWIQEAREDTEIVPTLEKYGCIEGHIKIDPEKVYGDFTQMKGLRNMLDQQKMAEQMFYDLPLETRLKFNNNMYEFADKGEEWLKSEIEKENTTVNTNTESEVTNG